MRFGIAGAGLSGSVVARQLALAGHTVVVHELRSHIAGNCHTARDEATGVMVHQFGPHVFHTNREHVWEYVNEHAEMMPFQLKVRTTVDHQVFSLPVNLHTINQVFGTTMGPTEARRFLADQVEPNPAPANFEQAALAAVGRKLYEMFFEGYTEKQWGCHPSLLPASVFRRLPLRFNYNDSYFDHPHQAIPRHGYTAMVESILDHPNITVELNSSCPRGVYDHLIWTGPIDRYFDSRHGALRYRTLRFQRVTTIGDFQGTPIMNYGDRSVSHTRITEHKHFAPWEHHLLSTVFVERSRDAGPDDEPFYPVRLADDHAALSLYLADAVAEHDTTFVGRLGTYRYLDMDTSISEALNAAEMVLAAIAEHRPIPSLVHAEEHQ